MTERSTPVRLSSLSDITAIARGVWTTFALQKNGTVWAWGANAQGQLGDGTSGDFYYSRLLPVQVRMSSGAAFSNVAGVVAAQYSTYAWKNDGSVWAWGCNAEGQVGDGTTINRLNPTQVVGLSNVTAVVCGSGGYAGFAFALRNDGTVWAWGYNINGRLGDGTHTSRLSPVQVLGLTNAIAIGCGFSGAWAVKSDGTTCGWGDNTYGQVGDGTHGVYRTSPVQVTGLSNVIARGYRVALKSDGSVWAWGSRSGDGTSVQRDAPVRVMMSDGVTPLSGFSAIFDGSSYNMVYSKSPTAPTGFTATTVATNQIKLAWLDQAADETGYVVDRSTDSNAWVQVE